MTNFNIYSSKFGQSTDDLPEGEVNLYLTNERIQAVIDSNTNFAPSGHGHIWGDISSAPATATRWPTWSEVTSKPTTFTPSEHTHSNITLTAGDGLSGGGTLAANRTINVDSTVVRTTGNHTFTGIKTFNIINNPVYFLNNESCFDKNMLINFNVWRGFDIRRIGSTAGSASLVLNSRVGGNSWAFSHQGNYSMRLEAEANPRVFIYHGINFLESNVWRGAPSDRYAIHLYNGQTYFMKHSTLSSSGVHTRFRVGGTNVSLINDSGDYVKGSSDMRFTTVFNESINSLD